MSSVPPLPTSHAKAASKQNRRFSRFCGWALVVSAGVLMSAVHGPIGYAAPKAHPTKRPAKESQLSDKAGAPPSTSLELVTLDEMQLGPASPKAPAEKKTQLVSVPKDSLDGLMNHSTTSGTAASTTSEERMQFPGEKEKAAAASAEKAEIVVPARVTSEIAAKAMAAASANLSKDTKAVASPNTVPKLPPKVKVGDDPLAGMSDKGNTQKGTAKGKASHSKKRFEL